MLTSWPKSALVALPLFLTLSPASDEVAFRPKGDVEVAKKFELEIELGLDDVSMNVNGQDIGSEAMGEMADARVLVSYVVGATDKYVKTKEGKALELVRTFDSLALHAEAAEDSEDNAKVKDLEGKRVRFAWSDDKKAYEKSFDGEDAGGEEKDLERLSPDMDVTCLLPDEKVAEGDTWTARGGAIGALFFPGGLPPMQADGGSDEGDAVIAEILEQLEKSFEEIKVNCTYKGSREDGSTRIGTIEFAYEGSAKLDLAEIVQDALESSSPGEAPDVEMTAELKMKGEGKLEWNLAAGHLHAFEMQADLGVVADVEAQFEQQGQSFAMTTHVAASGKGDWKLALK